MRQPWPSMLRTLYGDHDRYKTYFQQIKGSTSPATVRGTTRTAITGSWGGSTTC